MHGDISGVLINDVLTNTVHTVCVYLRWTISLHRERNLKQTLLTRLISVVSRHIHYYYGEAYVW